MNKTFKKSKNKKINCIDCKCRFLCKDSRFKRCGKCCNQQDTIICECGLDTTHKNKAGHIKSKKHKRIMAMKLTLPEKDFKKWLVEEKKNLIRYEKVRDKMYQVTGVYDYSIRCTRDKEYKKCYSIL